MSAYAALRGNSLNTSNSESNEEEPLKYVSNSSDDSSDTEDENELQFESLKQQPKDDIEFVSSKSINQSNFIPTEQNLTFKPDSIIVDLSQSQYILINGQFKLKILNGSIKLNNIHVLPHGPKVYSFTNISQSIPIIQPISPPSSSLDIATSFNSTIEIMNLSNGLEKLNSIYPIYKNTISDLEMFKNYTFEIILKDYGLNGLYIDDKWSELIYKLANSSMDIINTQLGYRKRKTYMIIGGKNSGKSTFCKTLLNSIIETTKNPCCYLDLDPGQSEYSIPSSLSMTLVENVNFGTHLYNIKEKSLQFYYGFSNPITCINRYESIILNQFKLDQFDQYPLIINTPGYIKGYGKELLIKICQKYQPDHLILLSSKLDPESNENKDILNDLRFDKLNILPGVYQNSKFFQPNQIRNLNKILYFHQKMNSYCLDKFLIDQSPLKLSYSTQDSTEYIHSFTILNHFIDIDFNSSDLPNLIEATIWAAYKISKSDFTTGSITLKNTPNYLNLDERTSLHDGFLGLAMIHSINVKEKYVNLYSPDHVVEQMKSVIDNIDSYLVFLRGDGEIPSNEMLYPKFIQTRSKSLKKGNTNMPSIPYISFEKHSKIGGVWKPRRNIMRRSHNRT